jgi:DNA-binding NarL/FixJ family response regulator
MEVPQMLKILYIEQVDNGAQRCAHLETGCKGHFLRKKLLADFTVVRDCLSALEQIAIVNFDVIVVHQHIKHVSGVEFMNAMKRFGYSIPCIFVTDGIIIKPETMLLARNLGYFSVILKASDFERLAITVSEAFFSTNVEEGYSMGGSSACHVISPNATTSLSISSDEPWQYTAVHEL